MIINTGMGNENNSNYGGSYYDPAHNDAPEIPLQAMAVTNVYGLNEMFGNLGGYLEPHDGGVKCLKDGHVLVSGSVYIGNGPTGTTRSGCYVYKNSEEILAQFIATGGEGAVSAGTRIIDVAAGDIIYLKGRCSVAATLYAANPGTQLSVMYL